MNTNRLTRGDQTILASGVVLVVASPFNWLGAQIIRVGIAGTTRSLRLTHYSFTHNAWGYTMTLIAVLLAIAMLTYTGLKALGLAVADRYGPLSAGQLMLGLGTISLVLVATKFTLGARADLASFGLPGLPGGLSAALRLSIHKTRDFAGFVGVVAATGLFVGGLLKFREERRGASPK